ncbi:Uncharacterised protein [[Clostridium] sordellii]|uniref:hypothetical protein n=1 Tax=Paraclostridium sordellii TaxID=1505 RepID=UPI0005DFFD72|nr:hypothetical protein [Paeniclostridium sordellii]CEP92096.1 Uncharacterised protein [[Clostridium] sordellii] [Paeniclostridium sordellii]
MNLKPLQVKSINGKVYIECRECNTYFKVEKKNQNCICPICNHKEELIVIHREGSSKNEKK